MPRTNFARRWPSSKWSAYLADNAADDAQRQENLDKINIQTERITDLVDGLMLMLRLNSGIELKMMAVDVNGLLMSITQNLAHDFPDKNIHVGYELDSTLALVQADSSLLRHALYALLHNAARAVADDGAITLVTSRDEDQLQMMIRDNGSGIDAEAIPHIFDRFYRVDKAHSTAGFGLGLPIARLIVELHEGRITAESQVNEGTTFTIHLPLGRAAPETGETEVAV